MDLAPLDLVVLIDDDSFDNKYHTRVINKSGLARNIRTFNMAEDALNWFRTAGPDAANLVLLDINMPRMDGFELLEAARAEFGELFENFVVVMLTTSLDKADQARAEKFPVVLDYVQKALTRESFENLVRLAQQRRAAQERV